MKRWHKCYLYQSSLLLETFPGTAKVAGDQKGSRKTAQQPGAGDWNFSTPGSLRLSRDSVLGASSGVTCVRATVATSSWVWGTQFAKPVVPSLSSPPSPPRPNTATSSSLFSSSLVPWAKRREWPHKQLTQHRHCLSHSPRTHHGPRGGIATQQRRRRWQPRRLSTTSLTTATTAHHPDKPSSPTAGDSRVVKAIFAIDSSYVNNYGGRGAAGDGRLGKVRHTQGPHPRGKASARPSKWRQQRRACVRNSLAVAPRPAGSEVLRGAARSVRRLRASGGQRKVPGENTNPTRRVPAWFCEKGSERKRLLPSVSAAEAAATPRSRGDEDAKCCSPPAAALPAVSATAVTGFHPERITGLSFLWRGWTIFANCFKPNSLKENYQESTRDSGSDGWRSCNRPV